MNIAQIVFALLTLYMLMILLRWFGSYISIDVETGRLSWIPRLTDPLIARIRRILPSMGPVDFGPIAALVIVWFVREVTVGVILRG